MTQSNHITTVSGMTDAFCVAILLLLAGSLVSLIAAHVADRGVDPLRDAVSDFGARQNPWFYRLTAIWLGAAGLLLAVVLADAMYPKPTGTILALLVFAAARWAITVFPTDLEGAEQTQTGRSHTMLAGVAFASIAVAALSFASAADPDVFWHARSGLLTALGLAVAMLAVLTAVARVAGSRFFGLVERLLYVAMYAWIAVVAVQLLAGS